MARGWVWLMVTMATSIGASTESLGLAAVKVPFRGEGFSQWHWGGGVALTKLYC